MSNSYSNKVPVESCSRDAVGFGLLFQLLSNLPRLFLIVGRLNKLQREKRFCCQISKIYTRKFRTDWKNTCQNDSDANISRNGRLMLFDNKTKKYHINLTIIIWQHGKTICKWYHECLAVSFNNDDYMNTC